MTIPGEGAKEKHKKWNVADRISYDALDATLIPSSYINAYDVITFKSVIGGIGSYKNFDREKQTVEEIGKALKDDGYVIFIENMEGAILHAFLRKKFRKHGNRWHYQSDASIMHLFGKYRLIAKQFYGFLGLFGPTERLRNTLGHVDSLCEPFIPERWKYIGVYVFQKA